MTPRSWTVSSDEAGERLDVLLGRWLDDASRSAVQRLIADRAVRIGKKAVKPSRRPRSGQIVTVELPERPAASVILARPDLAIDFLYEDEDLVVVNKPAGLVVHPAAGHADDTLVNALVARLPQLIPDVDASRAVEPEGKGPSTDAMDAPARQDGEVDADGDVYASDETWPGLVHRLDRDTTGVIVVGRRPEVARALQAQFAARKVKKTYLAVVHGVPSLAEATISAPIGRHPTHRKRMTVRGDGREAQTTYEVLSSNGKYALLALRPRTGRTHQIRVHLASIGHPIVGDLLYGARSGTFERPALHAWRLEFIHPVRQVPVSVSAPVPADLIGLLERLALEFAATEGR